MKENYMGVMIDCSRNGVMKPSRVKDFIDAIVKMNYNMLMLYTEDTYEVEGQPLFGYMRGRYTYEEINDMVEYADKKGVEIIPCIQTLAHLNQMFKWPVYDEIKDIDDILLVDNEKTYELIEDMFRSVRKAFKSEYVHIGMDEAGRLGLGKYLKLHGFEDRYQILSRHLKKVVSIAEKYNFKPMMWSDMFFHLACDNYTTADPDLITEEIANLVPENLELVYWDYFGTEKSHYDTMMQAYSHFHNKMWFAGSAIDYAGLAPHNGFSLKFNKAAMASCRENKVNKMFLTVWGDNGQETSRFTILPTLMYAAELYKGNDDIDQIKQKFKELFNIGFDDMMLLDLPSLIRTENNEGNMEKIMLYSDPFLGFYDYAVDADLSAESKYVEYAEKLAPLSRHYEFGYLFKTSETLCRLLSVKYTLGIRSRKAYKSGNVKELIERYKKCEELLEKFYNAICERWKKDEKPFGFEIIDIRIGGVKRRLMHCRRKLEQFDRGEINKIDELEIEILNTNSKCQNNIWTTIISPNCV